MYLYDKQERACQGELYRNLIFLEFENEKKPLMFFLFLSHWFLHRNVILNGIMKAIKEIRKNIINI